MTGTVLTVEKLNGYITRIFESEELLHNILVAGEVSNFSVAGTAAYFVVKDEKASLPCVCFDYRSKGYVPRNGDRVILKGSPNFYARLGKLSFLVSKVTETTQQGFLFLKYAALKARLEAEGKFEQCNRQIPKYAKTVGVVTSRTGAVIHDIITVAKRRNPAVNILLSPTKVQGVGADEEIAKGIRLLAKQNADVVIVARGGGSNEDIEAFYSEKVVNAICECPVPVVSAVGHETDFTLCDYAADVRAATPSVAAELCVFSAKEYISEVSGILGAIGSKTEAEFERAKFRLRSLAGDLVSRGSSVTLKSYAYLKNTLGGIERSVTEKFYAEQSKVDRARVRLEQLNPAEVLKKGYARIAKDGKVVSGAAELAEGDLVKITMIGGTRSAKIVGEVER